VKNYLSWCEVSINGGKATTMDDQTVNVDPGTVDLTSTPVKGFKAGHVARRNQDHHGRTERDREGAQHQVRLGVLPRRLQRGLPDHRSVQVGP